jgi:mannose-6-phosphate isomerase-like protein (cupin superfamily)
VITYFNDTYRFSDRGDRGDFFPNASYVETGAKSAYKSLNKKQKTMSLTFTTPLNKRHLMNNNAHIPINLKEKFSKFKELWTPKILTQFDGYYIKAAKMHGEFVWHSHAETDELFVVISGTLKISFRDGEVTISPGECFVVPKGIEHKPAAEEEVCCLLIEKAGTLNTGDQAGERTVSDEEWI